MTARAGRREDLPALGEGAVVELRLERDLELPRRCEPAGLPEVGRPRRREEILHVVVPILDRLERRAVASALADVEWRLPVVALLRIDGAQVDDVIDPALLGEGSDVGVDPLDRLVDADGVFAALEHVQNRLGPEALLPAFSVATRLAPAGLRIRPRLADRRIAPLLDFMLVQRPPGEVDDRVHRSGVGDDIHGQGRGIDDARPSPCDQLPFQPVLARPLPSRLEIRLYWLPTSASIFSHPGFDGSAGGFSGL